MRGDDNDLAVKINIRYETVDNRLLTAGSRPENGSSSRMTDAFLDRAKTIFSLPRLPLDSSFIFCSAERFISANRLCAFPAENPGIANDKM